MSCPDNLLTGSRRGVLGAEEAARLAAHLAQCPTCRLSLRLGQDFDELLQTQPGDELIAARFARNLSSLARGRARFDSSLARPRARFDQRGERRLSTLRYAWVAAAALAVVASAGLAAAAQLGGWPFGARQREPAAATQKVDRHVRSVRAPEPALSPLPAPSPRSEAALVEPAALAVSRVGSAAELFAQANEKRRAGELARAQRLYRELQQRYPRSAEVEVSRVSLGRVQLELGAAGAALTQFERYLGRRPAGPLAEEALFGKASALERLRRHDDERRTWERLLATFPGSIYANRGRLRLQTLSTRAVPRASEESRDPMP